MQSSTRTLAGEMASFVVGLKAQTLPPHVLEKLKTCLVNGFGIALSSTTQKEAGTARAAVLAIDGERGDGATLLSDGRKTTYTGAAVANSVLFYGSGGQCDTMGTVHMGLSAIPLTLAMVECGYPAERMLPALLAAYEVAGLLDQPYGRHSAAGGFRATPLYGAIGVAAAAGTMMGLDEDRMASALGMAASFTGGLLQPFEDGSAESRHQPGSSIRNGVAAAELARAGVQGAARAFEGRAGLVRAFARSECDVGELASRLGRDWSIDRVTFKPYPICAFNQTPVTAATALRERVNVANVAAIRVRMNPFETTYAGMDSKGPFITQTNHSMSIPFCIALTLLRGAPYTIRPLNVFDDQPVYDLVQKIDLITDDRIANLSTVIEADMKNGATVVQNQEMTFRDYTFSPPEIDRLVRRIGSENAVPDAAFDLINRFIDELPARASPKTVIDAFSLLKPAA